MKHYSENEYDDDLTVGSDEQDDSYYADPVDLFEFSTDAEAPIGRLKGLVLSIDWEITDDILVQFSEELQELKEIWADDKINLVYVQALEKICRYIYQKKADSHPNAIKLLLNLFHNLERITTTDGLAAEEKKAILVEDIKRFDNLKRAISRKDHESARDGAAEPPPVVETEDVRGGLHRLKAMVFAIDWHVTDAVLAELRQELDRLEQLFVGSRPTQVLLQGMTTITAYLQRKRQSAHASTLSLLQYFYGSLEQVAGQGKSPTEEKAVLLPAVERFNAFKVLIGSSGTAPPPPPQRPGVEIDDEEEESGEGLATASGSITPALADVGDEVACGFQADDEARSLGLAAPDHIFSRVENFFSSEGQVAPPAGEDEPAVVAMPEEEEPAPPAIEPVAEVVAAASPAMAEVGVADVVDDFFAEDSPAEPTRQSGPPPVDPGIALQGVEVESEADEEPEDSDLPRFGDEPAPALLDRDEVSLYNAELVAAVAAEDRDIGEVAGAVESFFAADGEEAPSAAGEGWPTAGTEDDVAPVFEEIWPETPAGPVLSPAAVEPATLFDDQLDSLFAEEVPVAPPESLAVWTDEGGLVVAAEEPAMAGEEEAEPAFAPVADDALAEIEPPLARSVAGEEVAAAETSEAMTVSGDDAVLSRLHAAIASLAGEDDAHRVAAELLPEVNRLRGRFAGQPLVKTFLQLLSTLGQHLNRYGYRGEEGGRLRHLLDSVSGALALSLTRPGRGPELLLAETLKVLQWQQALLAAAEQRPALDGGEGLPAEITAAAVSPPGDLFQEIVALRQTLLAELAEIRRELHDSRR